MHMQIVGDCTSCLRGDVWHLDCVTCEPVPNSTMRTNWCPKTSAPTVTKPTLEDRVTTLEGRIKSLEDILARKFNGPVIAGMRPNWKGEWQ